MTHRVVMARSASRQLAERLPETVAIACLEFILGPLADPHRVGAPLRPPFQGQFRARRGEYRVRYEITETEVVVLDVEHRRDAYRA